MSQPSLLVLVEDDADIREDMAALLRDEGYAVMTASNGLEALALLRDLVRAGRPPCLVLLDLMMPVMDGWAARREMIDDPDLATLPVFVVSGASNVPDHARRLGVAGYLVKPFAWDALVGAVRQYC